MMTPTAAAERVRWLQPPRTAPPGLLDSVAWGHVGGSLRALNHEFRIRATDRTVGQYLADAFAAFSIDADEKHPSTIYSLLDCGPTNTPYLLYVNDRRVIRHDDPSVVISRLMWEVNSSAIESAPDLVLVHAAVAERDGIAVVLPAAMEAGKTTLVAGLMQAGFRYLSDEAAAIDPATLTVRAFPKPLTIDRGSWDVLPALKPQVDERVRPYLRRQWLVSPFAIRRDAVAETATPRLVVFPRYVAGSTNVLEPASPAELLVELAPLTFDFAAAPRRNLAVLAALLEHGPCFRLTVGDLVTACMLVTQAADAAARTPGRSGRMTSSGVDASFVPRRQPAVAVVDVAGEIVFYRPDAECLHRLNAVGALIWREFDGVRPLAQIAADIASRLHVATARVERDVIAFARDVASAGLLEGVLDHQPPS